MSRESYRDVLNEIIATCDELRDQAVAIEHPLIAHRLEMVIIRAREVRFGDSGVDGELC